MHAKRGDATIGAGMGGASGGWKVCTMFESSRLAQASFVRPNARAGNVKNEEKCFNLYGPIM